MTLHLTHYSFHTIMFMCQFQVIVSHSEHVSGGMQSMIEARWPAKCCTASFCGIIVPALLQHDACVGDELLHSLGPEADASMHCNASFKGLRTSPTSSRSPDIAYSESFLQANGRVVSDKC